jgi:tRNA pseudouridine65 synthase
MNNMSALSANAAPQALRILKITPDWVAIDKPAGLLVHRTGMDAGETRFAMQLLRDQLGQRVWPVHRLDKPTSGVLVFAVHADAARQLTQAFKDGQVQKTYHAWVRGWPPDVFTIDHPLRQLEDDLGRHIKDGITQDALTHGRTLARGALPLAQQLGATLHAQTRVALVELSPQTGRRHQLRRHMKHIAHPILGDSTHGKGPLNRGVAALLGVQRLWLHASRLVYAPAIDLQAELGPQWGHFETLAKTA